MSLSFLFLSISTLLGPLSCQPGVGNGNLIINEGTVTVYGSLVDEKWSLNSFEANIPSLRRQENNYYIHDTFGITFLAYSKTNDILSVDEFKVMFVKPTESQRSYWWAKEQFEGGAIIEGFYVDHNTSFAELNNALPQYDFKDWSTLYHGEYKNIYIYAEFNEAETELIWMSIGRVIKY